MTAKLYAPPVVNQELARAGFAPGAIREIKRVARETGVPVAAGRLQVWDRRAR
jgi:hypothetical protein